jgi:outer membrane protein TolC
VIRLVICAVLALQNDRWTLDRLVDEALRANPQITQAEASLEASRQQLTEAQRAWWPSFSVEDSTQPAPNISCGPGFGPAGPFICADSNVHNIQQTAPDGALTRLELRMGWLLYGLGPLKDAAQQGVAVSEARVAAVRQDIAVQVRRAYWSVQLFRALHAMVANARTRVEEAIARWDEMVKQKKAKPTDRLRLEVQVTNVDTRIADAEKGEKLSMAALRVLVPTARDTLTVDGALAPIDLPERPLAYYVDAARVHRPESQMLVHGTRAARYYVDFVREQLIPAVLVLGSINGLVETMTQQDVPPPYLNHPYAEHGYGGGLLLHWELDFQNRLPRLRRAWQDWESARAGAGAAEAGIALEVTQSYETVAETSERMRILKEGDKSATRWLELAQAKFEKRQADAREFTDALLGWFASHGDYLQAIFDYDAAVAQLGRTTGMDLVGGKW